MTDIDPMSLRGLRIRRVLLAAATSAVAALAVWFVTRPGPARLVEQGIAAVRRDPAKGEQLFRRAIAAAGGQHGDAEIGLCLALAQQGEWDAAARQFKTLDNTTCNGDLLFTFGRLALKSGHRSEGREALKAVGDRGVSQSVPALELLTADYRESGEQEDLVGAARQMTKLEPENAGRWALLIGLLKAMYRETDCLAAVREALEHHPPPEFENEFRHRLVQQLIVAGDSAAAWKELARLHETGEGPPRMWRYQVDLYRLDGNPEKALETIQAVFPEVKDLPVAWYMRGAVSLDLGRFDEAAKDLEQAVTRDEYNALAQFKLSEAYRLLGREELARRHRDIGFALSEKRVQINELLKQPEANKNDPQFCAQLAELYAEIGEEEAARQWSRRAAAARN